MLTVVAQTNARPNVVVILVDDLDWSDSGCYGGEIPKPNLNALAARGVRFTQFYNTARCSPTRAKVDQWTGPRSTNWDEETRPANK